MGNSEIAEKIERLEADGMAKRMECDAIYRAILELLERGERPATKIILDILDVFFTLKEEEKSLAREHIKLSAILEDRVTNGVGGE